MVEASLAQMFYFVKYREILERVRAERLGDWLSEEQAQWTLPVQAYDEKEDEAGQQTLVHRQGALL